MAGTKVNYVGAPIPRREDDRLLRGQATFIDDVAEPSGTVFLAFLRSPHAHARIKSISIDQASSAPGVVGVFTGSQIAAATKPMETPTLKGQPRLIRPNMAIDVARYVGEAVAVVAAEDAYLAEDALELIDVEYEPLPAVLTVDDALAAGGARVHDYLPGNVVYNLQYTVPGTAEVFKQAKHVVADRFSSGRISAVAMETRGFLTTFFPGTSKLDHVSTAQFPHKMRWELADALRLPEKNVHVVAPQVGGSFGMKTVTYQEDVVGAVVARALGRPVKWLQDRQDDLTLMQGRDFHFDVEMAFDDQGLILGVKNKVVVDIGAYPLWIATAGLDAGGAGHHMMGPYRVKHYAYDVYSVVSNKAPTTSYRGVAAPMCVFATETLLERMAAKLKIDPIEIRRRNLVRPEHLPYANAVGVTHDSASHLECLERALAGIGYDEFKRAQSGKLGADGKYRGIGVVCFTDHTGQGTSVARSRGQASRWPGYDGASIRMEPDGKIVAHASFASQGQGLETVFAQIIADQLGTRIEDITVELGDTATSPFGTGAGASRAAVSGGGAVMKASAQVANKLRRIGAHMLEASVEDVVLEDGKVSVAGVPNLSVDFQKIAETAYMIGPGDMPPGETIGIEALEFFDPTSSTYSNAVHAIRVAVDAGTGRVAIEKYVVVHDCGRVLNPMIVKGQVVGAIVQGIGSVLTEAMRFNEEGQPITTTLLDYAIPTFLDVPTVELSHVESPSTTNPGGMRGAGETGVVGAVPGVALAVADALSSFKPNINSVPIMPDAILDIMQRAGSAK